VSFEFSQRDQGDGLNPIALIVEVTYSISKTDSSKVR